MIIDYIANNLNLLRDYIIDIQNILYQNIMAYTLFMFFVGMCFASFSGVIVYRIPIINNWFAENKDQITLNTRSSCNHCKHKLNILSLIPFFGYLFYKGKCFNCHGKIPYIYPLLELISGIICGLISFVYGPCGDSFFYISIYFFGLTIAWIDWNEGIIPDCLTLPLISIGLLYSPLENDILLKNEGMITGGFIFIISFWLLGKYKKMDLMSMGDVMLIAAIGSIIGQVNIIIYIIFSAIIYMIYIIFIQYVLRIKWRPNHEDILINEQTDLNYYPMGPSLVFSFFLYVIYLLIIK